MPMNDLQINLAMAEIEGIKVSQTGSTNRAFLLIIGGDTKDSIWEPTINNGQALLLMEKHQVDVEFNSIVLATCYKKAGTNRMEAFVVRTRISDTPSV